MPNSGKGADGPLKPKRVAPPGAGGDRPPSGPRGRGPMDGRSGGGYPRGGGGRDRPRPFGSKAPGSFRGGPAFDRKMRTAPAPKLEIVHEDADILVVDKPSGLLSANMPGEERESIFDQVKDHVKSQRKGRGPARVWIIHRLDKEASGLMVFAKSETSFHWLKEDFKAKRIKRMYTALVEGEIKGKVEGAEGSSFEGDQDASGLPSGTIQSFISEDEFGNVKSIGVGETARNTGADARREGWTKKKPMRPGETPDKPQLAVTHYRVLAVGNGRSLVQLRLETGRKNQIRLHLQEMGHPICGDRRFGATSDPVNRVALHATDLGFTHAKTGKVARFVSPAPDAFYHAVGQKPARRSPKEPEFLPSEEKTKPTSNQAPAAETSWDNVASWYDQLLEGGRGDHFEQVILPGALRMLKPQAGMKVLDIACGQGKLCRRMTELGMEAVGVDASPLLIKTAKERNKGLPARFEVADARDLSTLKDAGPFDAATCVMALMNIDPLEPVLRGAAELLKPGGVLIGVILHPAFRSPGQTSWGWGKEEGNKSFGGTKSHRHGGAKEEVDQGPVQRQFRRVDGYLSTGQMPITMNPGFAAHGAEKVQTWTFHRPIQTYTRLLSDAGFLIELFEEWPSQRNSQPGPKAAEENRARREIPMFLGFRAIKR